MRRWTGIRRLPLVCLAAGCLWLVCASLFGAEKTREFLDGLRERKLYDVALDYLETLREDPNLDPAFRETLDYQFGVTMIGHARSLPLEERERRLDEARLKLEKFLADHPRHELADSASRNLADLKIERGEALLNESRRPGKTQAEKRWLTDRARKTFLEARKSLERIDDRLVKKKQQYNNIDTDDRRLVAQLHRLVSEMMRTRFSLAKTYYDLAQTYPRGGKENTTYLREARAKFARYYWKYNRWLGGFSFRLEQARCYKELGEYDRAREILRDLALPAPDEDEGFRRLRSTATKLALEIDLLPEIKRYEEAWELFQDWEKGVHRPGRIDETDAAIHYLGGEAALELARRFGENDPQQARLRATYRKRAEELLSLAARYPGEYKLKARLKLTDPLLAAAGVEVETPKSYEEARDRAGVAWDQCWQPELEAKQVERMRAEALECLRYALAHPPRQAELDELNTMRYRLAYLSWVLGEYYDAAALGEFLARAYLDRPEGPRGAKLALAAYTGMMQETSAGAEREFETRRIAELARFAAEHWPKEPLADDARCALIQLAVADGDPQEALRLLGLISADSPRRGQAELLAGQALWRACLEAARLPKHQQPTSAKMAEMLSQARRMLTDGVRRLRNQVDLGREPSYYLLAGTLSLAQICLREDKGEEAVRWLDDPKIGAHALVKAGNKAADRGNFRVETFKAALRAYVATERLTLAEQAMDALERAAPAENLTQTYISLGRELEKTLHRLQAEGNREEADRAARGFELFLTRIANRPAEQITFGALYWVAETFVELAGAVAPGDGPLPPEAERYHRKAGLAYGRIVDICRKDKEFAPRKGTVSAIQIRLARCLRRLGMYGEAMNMLVEVLAESNNLIDAQLEAAYTYQDWGREKPGYYLLAIRGGRQAKKKSGEIVYLVWGWSGIARKVQFSQSHQDIFYEARFNQAKCRLEYGLHLAGDKKTEQLHRAEQDVLMVQRLRPDLGGKKWYNKFDALLRDIQKQLGAEEKQRGLEAFEKKISAAAKQ